MDNPPPRKKYYRPSIPWDETMEIGPGSHHDLDFIRRINKNENRTVGNGTVEDPKVGALMDLET
ncbi:hypothetical protein RRF57_010003 [Xylaria bambusicola]|uniref:Uncharacterized protein n=1 Tax=Xylaria bambusicola TaxID=326684 RepID=A0AAN7V099_9PEZI